MTGLTTCRHSREDVGEEVRVGVGVCVRVRVHVGTVECQLISTIPCVCVCLFVHHTLALRQVGCKKRTVFVSCIA